MAIDKEEYKFPDEQENEVEVETSGETEVEIEVVDDTLERDRGRKPLEREVADPTDEEIESYSANVQVSDQRTDPRTSRRTPSERGCSPGKSRA
jgi:hypothetical protein